VTLNLDRRPPVLTPTVTPAPKGKNWTAIFWEPPNAGDRACPLAAFSGTKSDFNGQKWPPKRTNWQDCEGRAGNRPRACPRCSIGCGYGSSGRAEKVQLGNSRRQARMPRAQR